MGILRHRSKGGAVHVLNDPGEPTLNANCVQIDSLPNAGIFPPRFWKDSDGLVHLEGTMQNDTDSGGIWTMFNLPEGFRPEASTSRWIPVGRSTNGTTMCRIAADGNVLIYNGATTTQVSIDGVIFRPANV